MSQHDRYISPFSTRYSSDEMQYIFSDDNKFRTWRRLWVALARAEMKQGLTNITPEMVAELETHVDDINYEVAIEREKLVRHDVMSHVYAYGQQCPKAAGIIHLGATSCYVGDNTDIIVMRQGLELVRKKLIGVLAKLAKFAEEYKDMPCMAYTHCQPAQPTTVGKRATLWANELVMDLNEIDHRLVRGLDYYCRTTFEVVSGSIGAQAAVAGGGRYDGLVKSVGGPDVPGVGFACGMERLALMLGDEEAPRPDFYAVAMDAQSRDLSFGLVQRLRGLGLKGEMNFSDAGFKGLMRQAGKSNARFCCIMGPDEAAAGAVVVKDMDSGEQQTLSLDAAADFLAANSDNGKK